VDSGLFLSDSHQKEKTGMTWCGVITGMTWCGVITGMTWCGVITGMTWCGVITGMTWRTEKNAVYISDKFRSTGVLK